MLTVELSTFAILLVSVLLFILLNDSITLYGVTYQFDIYLRVFLPIIMFILLVLLFVAIFFIDKHFKKINENLSTYHISFAAFILEVLVMLIFGSLMKVWAFSSTAFLPIFICQLIVLFFNVPLNTFLISYIMNLSKRIFKVKDHA